MRSKRMTQLPSHAQKKVLQGAVYYKKVLARVVVYLDIDLTAKLEFRNSTIAEVGLGLLGLTPLTYQMQ